MENHGKLLKRYEIKELNGGYFLFGKAIGNNARNVMSKKKHLKMQYAWQYAKYQAKRFKDSHIVVEDADRHVIDIVEKTKIIHI